MMGLRTPIHLAVTLMLLACGDNAVDVPPPPPTAGNWDLLMYNGEMLPAATSTAGGPAQITSGSVVMARTAHGGTFVRVTRITTSASLFMDTLSMRETGDWTFTNDGVAILRPTGEDARTAFVTNNQLTLTEGDGRVYVYARKPE